MDAWAWALTRRVAGDPSAVSGGAAVLRDPRADPRAAMGPSAVRRRHAAERGVRRRFAPHH